jgi:hypothetical protein
MITSPNWITHANDHKIPFIGLALLAALANAITLLASALWLSLMLWDSQHSRAI